MAINFPSTAGQPTDGTYIYVVAGITYSWNGESWRAAGSGATATDRTVFSVSQNPSSGSGALSYNSNTGVFDYTPPDLSPYMTTLNGGTGSSYDADLLDGQQGSYYTNAGNLNTGTISSDRLTGSYNISITGSAATANAASFGINGLVDVSLGSLTTNQILSFNGSTWVNTNAPTGLQSRTSNGVSVLLSNGATSNQTITTPKTYVLHSITTSHAAWVTLYTDTTSRSNDASRAETTDPLPGSGVIAEVITTGSSTQKITPGVIGFNLNGTDATYVKIVNKSGATNTISVTLNYVQLEA